MNLKELLNNIEFDYKIIKDDEGKNIAALKTSQNQKRIKYKAEEKEISR